METKTVNLLDLSDSQKAEVLEQARTFLKQQLAEAKYCRFLEQAKTFLQQQPAEDNIL